MTMDVTFDAARLRNDFPIFEREVHGKPLIYLDSANTAQRPQAVIDAVDDYYRRHNANVARAVHALGEEATGLYEGARRKLAGHIGAQPADVVLTSGTTQSINLVAYSWALPRLKAGDSILVSQMEHHANIVPWQLVAERSGASIKVAPIHENGELDIEALHKAMTPDVKLLALTHVSNVLGTINPVAAICREARQRGIITVIDGSQALPHRAVDVPKIGCDFYALTGHKMFGPTGTGALWARREHLESMPPFFGGGEMIREVSFDGTVFADPPHKFEAGTPNIAGFIGLGAAVDYLDSIGMPAIEQHEAELCAYALDALRTLKGLRIIGDAKERAAVISFLVDGAHAHDLATLLDLEGVAVRSGHHCAHPLMRFYGVAATCRASMALYSTRDDIDRFVAALHKAVDLLA
ncbi:MAG: cysteine desulfurase [Lysobacteraceae bacterium]